MSILHKFVRFHLMENLPFNLPHTIYINILRNPKGLGVFHVFEKMDNDSKHTVITKGSIVAKHKKFSKSNLKAMKVVMQQTLKEAP